MAVDMTERMVEQRSTTSAQNPEPEPDRADRAPTADLSRDPQDRAPLLVRREVEATPPEPPELERQTTRASPTVDDRVPSVLTVPSIPIEHEKKASTAASGIVAPPSWLIQPGHNHTEVEKKPRNKTPNYPSESRYPPAPAYSLRDTPAWTEPDAHTPSPEPKAEPVPKKRRSFEFRSILKEEPQSVQRSAPEPRYGEPEPQVRRSHKPRRDQPVKPFRHAAPGQVPGPSEGTPQRPRGYSTAPGLESTRRASAPIPVRSDDHFPRAAPTYARKDDHYPILAPIVQDRRNDYSQAQPALVQRDIHPLPQISSVSRELHPQPFYFAASAHRDDPWIYQEQTRDRLNVLHPDEAGQQPVPHQLPAEQDLRNLEKDPPLSCALAPRRRPQAYGQPPRARLMSQEETTPGPVRRDVRSNSQTKSPSSAQEASQPRKVSIGGLNRLATAEQDGHRRPTRTPTSSAQRPQERAPEPIWQPTGRIGEQSNAESEAEADEEEDGALSPGLASQDQRDSPGRHSIDSVSSTNAGPSVSRKDTEGMSDLSRRTSAQDLGEDMDSRQPRIRLVDDRQPRLRMEDGRQHQLRERRRLSRERQHIESTEVRQHERRQRLDQEALQPRLGEHERSTDRQQRQVRQSRKRQIWVPVGRVRQHRQRARRGHQ